jgi:glutathione S-transferase
MGAIAVNNSEEDPRMVPSAPIALSGSPGSPYTRKMLAVLRYRRIPYRFLVGSQAAEQGLPQPKVRLLPTFYLPDETGDLQAVTDSSPIIRRLERTFGARPLIPADPALAFLDSLIEDFGDEWLTKAMFHYRWVYGADIEKAAEVLPNWMGRPLDDEELSTLGRAFAERQIGRLRYVGSNEITKETIEASYKRLILLLDQHFSDLPFLLGARPGAGDFGLFGQLTQLAAFDPTPMTLATEMAPRVVAWTHALEDLSGLEPSPGDWIDPAAPPATVKALLVEIGRVYAPLLLANAKAVQTGAAEVAAEIDGRPWTQQAFPYQAKCLAWLRADYAALSPEAKAVVDAALKDTGCEALIG